jgi:hypothetical protein
MVLFRGCHVTRGSGKSSGEGFEKYDFHALSDDLNDIGCRIGECSYDKY